MPDYISLNHSDIDPSKENLINIILFFHPTKMPSKFVTPHYQGY